MNLSIIVPCYNGLRFIPSFMGDLNKLLIPETIDLEIIIVDNGSTDESMKELKTLSLKLNPAISFELLSYTDIQGSYAARNFGVAQSKGSILAFTDIDCRLPFNFLYKLIDVIKPLPQAFIAAGNVELNLSPSPNVFEYYDFVFGFNMKSYVKQHTGVTANTVIDRKSFEASKGFDEVESGGDRMFYMRVLKQGDVTYAFNDELEVFHPCRDSYKEIAKKAKRVGRGLAHYASKSSAVDQLKFLLKNLFGAIIQPNQFRVVRRSKKVRKQLSTKQNLFLIALIFWMGFYSRIYNAIQLIKLILKGSKNFHDHG